MNGQQVAGLATAAENDGFPEGNHFRKVRGPVGFGHIIENED